MQVSVDALLQLHWLPESRHWASEPRNPSQASPPPQPANKSAAATVSMSRLLWIMAPPALDFTTSSDDGFVLLRRRCPGVSQQIAASELDSRCWRAVSPPCARPCRRARRPRAGASTYTSI